MLDAILRRLALEALAGRAPSGIGFWDLQYLYRFGVPTIPSAVFSRLTIPPVQPDTNELAERVQLHEEILFTLVSPTANDLNPQPSLEAVVGDRAARLEAARGLATRLELGLKQVSLEIQRLEKLPPDRVQPMGIAESPSPAKP
jgi:hypothetical protein